MGKATKPPPKQPIRIDKSKVVLLVEAAWVPSCYGSRDSSCLDDRFCSEFFHTCKQPTS